MRDSETERRRECRGKGCYPVGTSPSPFLSSFISPCLAQQRLRGIRSLILTFTYSPHFPTVRVSTIHTSPLISTKYLLSTSTRYALPHRTLKDNETATTSNVHTYQKLAAAKHVQHTKSHNQKNVTIFAGNPKSAFFVPPPPKQRTSPNPGQEIENSAYSTGNRKRERGNTTHACRRRFLLSRLCAQSNKNSKLQRVGVVCGR